VRYFLFIGVFLFSVLTAYAEPCRLDLPAKSRCRLSFSRLSPSQGAVGMWEVDRVEQKLLKISENPKKLKKYLKGKRTKVVIGPDGKYHVIDGHHHAVAQNRLGWHQAYVEVVENFSGMSEQNFWREMKTRNWLRLTGKNGAAITVEELPKTLAGLKDDPYRSLAGIMSSVKGTSKSTLPFAEFIWADFLREHIPLSEVKDDWNGAVKAAIRLGFTQEAQDLPGFRELKKKKTKKVVKQCWQQFQVLAR
jgi:hypothetical protein